MRRRPSSATPRLQGFSTEASASGDVMSGYRFGSNLPPSRTMSGATSSYTHTPMSSDLQTSHDQPFDQDPHSLRNAFGPVRRASSSGRALQLTREEGEKLQDLSTSLLNDVIAAYETHVHTHNRQIDASHWKLVKKRDHLVVAKQRRKGWSSDALPTMMAFGSIAGQLDDLLYGLSSETSLEMKLQGSYASGTLHDAAVLAVLDTPCLEEPFRFVGVKWVLQSFGSGGSSSSASAKTLLKRRDLMYLESNGACTLASGEQVGYRIQHSVNFKSMAHLSDNAVRAKVSLCQLFRQRSDGKTLDVFMRGYYDPSGGRVSQMLATTLSADIMLQAPNDALECTNLKKLAWCAKQSGRRRRKFTAMMRQTRKVSAAEAEEMRLAAEELGMNNDQDPGAQSQCVLCHKDCSGLLRRSASACMVCSQLVCSRCSVTKKLSFTMGPSLSSDVMSQQQEQQSWGASDATPEIRQKALSFCLHCIVASNRERAFDVAVSDLVERGVGEAPQSHPHATPATSSANTTPASRAGGSAVGSGRARQSSLWQGNEDRYSQFLPTPQNTRRRATTTSGKRLTTVLSANGLTPSNGPQAAYTGRGKAFSVVSGANTASSSGHDSEELN